VLAEPGPVFADLKIVSSGPQARDYTRLHGPAVRKAFKEAPGASAMSVPAYDSTRLRELAW
jgi:hypothetical protein